MLVAAIPSFVKAGCLVSALSPEEKRNLETLFRNLFLDKQFGYTLLGDKPASVTGHFKVIPPGNMHPMAYTFNQEWETWEKQKLAFDHYLLLQRPHPKVKDLRSITFINKRAFLEVVRENIDLFQERLGALVSAEGLLEEIEHSSLDLKAILYEDEALYGIVLGYGRHNALLFKRYFELFSSVDRVQASDYPFSPKIPRRKNFFSLQEELKYLERKLSSPPEKCSPFSLVAPVYFGGDPEDEQTEVLREKYRELRKKITAFYSEGNCFEKTLEILLQS